VHALVQKRVTLHTQRTDGEVAAGGTQLAPTEPCQYFGVTPETSSPGPGRWHYGWAIIGSAAGAFAFGGFLGVSRALSYNPPAWGYAAISAFAGAAALGLAIKAMRRYGSPKP